MKEFKIIRCKLSRAILAHTSKPIWIVRYRATLDRAKFYQAYIAIDTLIQGQHPGEGGVNNRRIGGERGFRTLQAAIQAVQNH